MRYGWVLALLVGCGKDGGGKGEDDLTECEGAGDPALELGTGGLDGFEPWSDGVVVPVEQNGDVWGFRVELLTEGIDTTSDVTSFVRYRIGAGGETLDAGATLALQCPEEGPGWYGVFVPLDDQYQDEAAAAALAGSEVLVDGTVTDVAAETATDTVDIVLGAP